MYRMGYNKPATKKECEQANIVCDPNNVFGNNKNSKGKKNMSELLY